MFPDPVPETAPKRAMTGESDSNRLPLAILAGVAVMLALLGGFYLLGRYASAPGSAVEQPLPFGEAEQAYAPQIHFSNPKMSRAANALDQEVTFIVGTLENSGERTVRQIEVTVEFHDLINQVILREVHRLLPQGARVAPGQQRDFQMNFDRVPNDWNRQYPSLDVTGLQLE